MEIENDGNTQTVYVVDGIQEREELVGESEVGERHNKQYHYLLFLFYLSKQAYLYRSFVCLSVCLSLILFPSALTGDAHVPSDTLVVGT